VRKAIVGLVVAGGLLLAVSGCGSSGSSLSKAEFDQKLELACNKGLKEREELLGEIAAEYQGRNRKLSAKEQAEEQSANIKRLMAVYQGTTEEIAEIGHPDQGEKAAEELVQVREDVAKKVEADPTNAIANASALFAKASKAAESFNVASCAK
jgi:hypothetical protein